MVKTFYKLTAKYDVQTDFAELEKGTEIYTYHPEKYDEKDFDREEWDINKKFTIEK